MSLRSSVRLLVKLVMGKVLSDQEIQHTGRSFIMIQDFCQGKKKKLLDGEDMENSTVQIQEVGETYSGIVIKGRNVSLCNEKQNFYFSILSWGIKFNIAFSLGKDLKLYHSN